MCIRDRDGTLYIVVSADAKPEMYNPIKDAESLVLDAVNIGLQVMHKAPEDELKSMVPVSYTHLVSGQS